MNETYLTCGAAGAGGPLDPCAQPAVAIHHEPHDETYPVCAEHATHLVPLVDCHVLLAGEAYEVAPMMPGLPVWHRSPEYDDPEGESDD